MIQREIFIKKITELAEKDGRIFLIVGDVGWSFVESFAEKFPDRFLNAGVAEQNMMGVAVGLSLSGWKPYVYSMRNFIVFRAFEQVRGDIAYANTDVKIFGVSGGESYKHLGYTHNIPDDLDIEIMERLPNMNVYRTLNEESMAFESERKGPAYFIL